MQVSETQDSSTIDCSGLSTVLTLLRIKQAVTTAPDAEELPLAVSIDPACDAERLAASLREFTQSVRLTFANAV